MGEREMNIFENKCLLLGIYPKGLKAGALTDMCPQVHGNSNHRAKRFTEATEVSLNR